MFDPSNSVDRSSSGRTWLVGVALTACEHPVQPVCDTEFMQAMKDHATGSMGQPEYESPTTVEPEPDDAEPEPEPEPEEPAEDLPEDEEEEEEVPEEEVETPDAEPPVEELPDFINLETPKAEHVCPLRVPRAYAQQHSCTQAGGAHVCACAYYRHTN
jgi:outer membrane biosynthesis protein TonB